MIWLPTSLDPPLLKLPLLWSATWLAVRAQSPPTPPPRKDEMQKFESVGDTMVPQKIMRGSVLIQNSIYWTNAVCETAVVLSAYASPSTRTTLLSLLAREPSAAAHIQPTAAWLAGAALMHAGALVRLACYRALGADFTWELAVRRGHVLATRGPYAVVRHPSYVGAALIYAGALAVLFGPGGWFGACVGWGSVWSWVFAGGCAAWAVGVPVMLMRRVGREDEVLRQAFGEEWEAYARRVPYRLVPYIF
ncbi:isoprenylcysteine carboxylmethyltransferase family protein [Phanerochaete sordida]|uniref:Isoprenylcysteine carboxylmethyltransferase family protein n=1 Tax=Phanerochaete sordida TaxID=48140 RepID=A0A9P3GKP8_9APHY|nr:isoprenylcysteine carboxylmethyltransferase family protein [Phanerochaete sordida]